MKNIARLPHEIATCERIANNIRDGRISRFFGNFLRKRKFTRELRELNLNIPIHIHELRVAFLFASLNEKDSNVVCNKEETKRSNDVKRKSEHHGKRAGNSAKSVVFRGCVSKLNVS